MPNALPEYPGRDTAALGVAEGEAEAEAGAIAMLAAKIVNMSIRSGNGPASPQGYVLHGLVIGSLTGDYQAGYDFGSAAVTLSKRFDDIGVRCNALYVFAGYITPWIKPLPTCQVLLDDSYNCTGTPA